MRYTKSHLGDNPVNFNLSIICTKKKIEETKLAHPNWYRKELNMTF